jgi:hypothetical protein
VGNQWTYKKKGTWEELGMVISKLNLSEEWTIVGKNIINQGTSYKVEVIQNGYKTENGVEDTTWIEDRMKQFKIIEKDENTITTEGKTYLNIDDSENMKRLQPLILGEEVTFGDFRELYGARRFKKGVGLIKGKTGGTPDNSKSPWHVTLDLVDYQLK